MAATERGRTETDPRLSQLSHDGNVHFIPDANAFLDAAFLIWFWRHFNIKNRHSSRENGASLVFPVLTLQPELLVTDYFDLPCRLHRHIFIGNWSPVPSKKS